MFYRDGNTWMMYEPNTNDVFDKLPVGNYVVKFHPMKGHYLEEVKPFIMPTKIYGELPMRADRILTTFNNRKGGTGVLLTGEKGAGKSLLAKMLAVQSGLPVILVTEPHRGDSFNKMLQMAGDAVVLLDEFEKVYQMEGATKDPECTDESKSNPQTQLLTMLDGTFSSRKLFVLTCNDEWKIDKHMINRPGRLYYRLSFKGLDPKAIKGYVDDVLKNAKHAEAAVELAVSVGHFTFDMLSALVEEMNRFDLTAQDAIEMLNIKPDTDMASYRLEVFKNGKKLTSSSFPVKNKADKDHYEDEGDELLLTPNPLTQHPLQIKRQLIKRIDRNVHSWVPLVTITDEDMASVDHDTGSFTWKVKDYTVVATKEVPRETWYYGRRMAREGD